MFKLGIAREHAAQPMPVSRTDPGEEEITPHSPDLIILEN